MTTGYLLDTTLISMLAPSRGDLAAYELRQTLGIETRFELHGFLKQCGVIEPATLEDVQRDMETLTRLGD